MLLGKAKIKKIKGKGRRGKDDEEDEEEQEAGEQSIKELILAFSSRYLTENKWSKNPTRNFTCEIHLEQIKF